jgi:hypothetical protein
MLAPLVDRISGSACFGRLLRLHELEVKAVDAGAREAFSQSSPITS